MSRRRIQVLGAGLLVPFLLLAGRLFSMQVVSGPEYELAAWQRLQRTTYVAPRRGAILDRKGRPLAASEPGFDLAVVPAELTDISLDRVAGMLGVDMEELRARLAEVESKIAGEVERELARSRREAGSELSPGMVKKVKSHHRGRPWLLWPDLADVEACLEIYVHPDRYPGFTIQGRAIRRYPEKDLACHVVGHLSKIYQEEYEELRLAGYFLDDLVGRSGIEGILEDRLRGTRGMRVTKRDRRNDGSGRVYDESPRTGEDVRLALDIEMQRAAEVSLDRALERARAFAARTGREPPAGGAAVVLDVRTGEVYVLATTPRYDANRFAKDYGALSTDPAFPLIDRAVAAHRLPQPGSVFKIVAAIAGLETGVLSLGDIRHCRGFLHQPNRFKCNAVHGDVDLELAIEASCNVYFYALGEEITPEDLARWARAFGFGERTGIEVDRELAGLVPDPAWKAEAVGEPWVPADSRYLAIGQGYLEVTPLQVARFMAAVATGRLVTPRLVIGPGRPVESRPVGASESTLEVVRRGMRRVVEGNRGTARRIEALARFHASAKTGTAETGTSEGDHAWIAGFAPRSDPRIAFAVLIENAGHGGEVAGPVAGEILEAVFARLGDGR